MRGDVLSFEHDAPRRRRQHAQHGKPRGGLARAALADEAERLAAADGEGDAIDGFYGRDLALEDDSLGDGKMHLQILDAEDRFAGGVLRKRVRHWQSTPWNDDRRPEPAQAARFGTDREWPGSAGRRSSRRERWPDAAAGPRAAPAAGRRRRRAAARTPSAPTYRDALAAHRARAPARPRRCGRHT